MKMYLIIYDVAFDEDVNEALSSSGITGFTKWDRVLGKGELSDPKMDDAVWPGYNCTIMAAVSPSEEPDLKEAMQSLYIKMGSKGLRVFGWEVEQLL